MNAPDTGQTQGPIDAVYSWVDGSDPDAQMILESFRHSSIDEDSTAGRRFRDNGELKHSLRSLEQHAPWIRKVFIVHAGGLPARLDTAHPNLQTVLHEEIFPDASVLPSFNSKAIELNLHRIPGLSRQFLYLNDDFFMARDTPLAWFLPSDGLPRFFFEANVIPIRGASRTATDKAFAYTLRLQPWKGSHRNPAVAPSRTGWRRLLGRAPRCNMTAHVPQLYDQDLIRELEARFPAEFQATRSHRFRAPDDLSLRILYAYSGLALGQLEAIRLGWNSPDFLFVSITDDIERNRGALERLEQDPPRSICVNDDAVSEDADSPALLHWKEVMAKRWPLPSKFERSQAL
jgi:hypothetical protein